MRFFILISIIVVLDLVAFGRTQFFSRGGLFNNKACKDDKECFNRGACSSGICLCRRGYSGKNCQDSEGAQAKALYEGDCKSGPCENGGYCPEKGGKCYCTRDFAGSNCQYRRRTYTICEDDEKVIGCPVNEGIIIDYALWGRHKNDRTCPGNQKNKKKWKACGDGDKTRSKLQARCQKQQGCTLSASNSVFDDPCLYQAKYLFVRYHCESIEKVAQWSTWQPWSDCTASCEGGSQMRRRACIPGADPAKTCVGDSTQTRLCNPQSCTLPLQFIYGSWSEWSLCAQTCGPSTRSRNRDCYTRQNNIIVSPSNCANMGESVETAACSNADCPKGTDTYSFGKWKDWEGCSVSCGEGVQLRRKECIRSLDNAEVTFNMCENTLGGATQSRLCSLSACIQQPTHVFGNFNEWSACSTTCGPGSQFRRKQCLRASDSLEVDFNFCLQLADAPDAIQSQQCIVRQCQQTYRYGPFTSYNSCSVSCGGGTRSRQRTCYNAANIEVAAAFCEEKGLPIERTSCNLQACEGGKSAPFGYYYETKGYCDSAAISLNFITLESCALACYQWIDCRGITYDASARKCWPLKDWCDDYKRTTEKESYRKDEPAGFICGLSECNKDVQDSCIAGAGGSFDCKGDPQPKSIIGFRSDLELDSNCADQCRLKTSTDSRLQCKSFLWGPNQIQAENPDDDQVKYYSDKPNFLPCYLFNQQTCSGFRSSSRARYCRRA